MERLASYRTKMVRLGHPARLLPQIQNYALDAVVAGSDETEVVTTVRSEINDALVRTNQHAVKKLYRNFMNN